jgi:hypothetical protein
MGDMADYIIDQFMDPQWMEEWDGDPEFVLERERECDFCGTVGLHWRQHKSGKWWLADDKNEWHKCKVKEG